MDDKRAYHELYLLDVMHVTEYLFILFIRSGKDYFTCVTKYMNESEIRQRMDLGNWSALNKGVNQLMESVDISDVPMMTGEYYIDEGISEWIADMYVYLQWRYCIPSVEIIKRVPVELLYKMFYPLHEASIENGCEKLKKNFFQDWGKEETK